MALPSFLQGIATTPFVNCGADITQPVIIGNLVNAVLFCPDNVGDMLAWDSWLDLDGRFLSLPKSIVIPFISIVAIHIDK